MEMSLQSLAPVLLLAVPGLLWMGRFLVARVEVAPEIRIALEPTVALSVWLVVIHGLSLVFSSFYMGLWAGTILLSLCGVFLRISRSLSLHPLWVGSCLAVSLVIGGLAFGWAFHDETPLVGHLSITSQILSDVFPPRFTSFPEYALRYHYWFNILAASVAAMTSLEPGMAIDVATVLMAVLTWGLLWGIGERLMGKGGGLWCAALGLFSAGLAMGILPEEAPLGMELLGMALVDGTMLNPPTLSYFFQHPWTLGLPLGLGIMALLLEDDWNLKRSALLGVLFLSLSFTQVVLFVTLLPTAIAVVAFRGNRLRIREGLSLIGISVIVVILSSFMGGMWTPRADSLDQEFVIRLGVTGGFSSSILWHFHSFGLPLLLGIGGLWTLKRGQLMLGLLMGGSLLVINTVTYTVSWDILKFATVAQLALAMGTGGALYSLWKQGKKGLTALCLVVSVLYSFFFVGAFLGEVDGVPSGTFPEEHDAFSPEEREIGLWLQTQVDPTESVLVEPAQARAWAQHTGLGSAWTDGTTKYFGASEERIARRKALLNRFPTQGSLYRQEGIGWAVLSRANPRFSGFANTCLEQGEATLALEHPAYFVLRFENKEPRGRQ